MCIRDSVRMQPDVQAVQDRQIDPLLVTRALHALVGRRDLGRPERDRGLGARDRARVSVVGLLPLEIPRKAYYEKELEVIVSRSYGPGRYDPDYEERGHDYPIGYVRWTERRNLEAVLFAISTGRLDVKSLITHRYPFDRALDAGTEAAGVGEEDLHGVLLNWVTCLQAGQDDPDPSDRQTA